MPSLQAYRRELAQRPGLGYLAATAGVQLSPPSGAYTGTALAANARLLVSSDLADIDAAGDDATTAGDWWDGAWVYLISSTPEQRRLADGGYQPNQAASLVATAGASSDIVGTLIPSRPFGAVVAAGTPFELHTRVPPLDGKTGETGLHHWINRALAAQTMTQRIVLTAVANQYRYSLAAYPWLTRADQLAAVWDRETLAGSDPFVKLSGLLRFDAATPYLLLGQPPQAGYTFSVDVYRPRSTWIRTTLLTGTCTIATATTIGDETQTWVANAYAGMRVALVSGNGYGQVRDIVSNTTGGILTVSPGWTVGPLTAGDVTHFAILDWASSVVGLVNEYDEASADLYPTAAIAYYFLCDQLALDDPRGESKTWADRRNRAAQIAGPYLKNQQQREPDHAWTAGARYGDSPAFLRYGREGGPYWGARGRRGGWR